MHRPAKCVLGVVRSARCNENKLGETKYVRRHAIRQGVEVGGVERMPLAPQALVGLYPETIIARMLDRTTAMSHLSQGAPVFPACLEYGVRALAVRQCDRVLKQNSSGATARQMSTQKLILDQEILTLSTTARHSRTRRQLPAMTQHHRDGRAISTLGVQHGTIGSTGDKLLSSMPQDQFANLRYAL